MNAALLPTSTTATLLRGFAQLFWLYFSWRALVLGSTLAGLTLLASAVISSATNPYLAYTLSLLAYSLLLGVPLMSAAPVLRILIGHRSLSLVPHLPLLAGLALLVLTLLTSIFVPVVAALLDVPYIGIKFGVQLFIVASFYIAVVQVLMPSQYAVIGFSLLPAFVVILLSLFGVNLMGIFRLNEVLLVTLAGWVHGLGLLAGRTAFKPPHHTGNTEYTSHNWMQGFTRILGLDLGNGANSTGTLLFAYPASIPVHLINLSTYVIVSPLVSALLLWVIAQSQGKELRFIDNFMLFSLICGCISCWSYGELGARARLLWLRTGGNRSQLWQVVEREVWTSVGVLLALVLTLALIGIAAGTTGSALHYCLILLLCALFDIYLGLCARLCRWPSLVQALVMLASVLTLGSVVLYSTSHDNTAALVWAEALMLLAATLLRSHAKARFTTVDWLQVRQAISKNAGASA